ASGASLAPVSTVLRVPTAQTSVGERADTPAREEDHVEAEAGVSIRVQPVPSQWTTSERVHPACRIDSPTAQTSSDASAEMARRANCQSERGAGMSKMAHALPS